MVKPGEMMRLCRDVESACKSNKKNKILYGERGSMVKVISVIHYPVLIVDGKTKFPVMAELLNY